MDPNQVPSPAEQPLPQAQSQPQQEKPTSTPIVPTAVSTPASTVAPQVIAPLATPSTPQPEPTSQASTGLIPENATNKIKATAITAIILGVLMILVGIAVAYFLNVLGALNCLFGIGYLVFGFKLRSKNAPLSSILNSLKILNITVILNLLVSILSGNGAGVLPLLVIIFSLGVYKQLFEAGLTTSKAPFKAKPIVS